MAAVTYSSTHWRQVVVNMNPDHPQRLLMRQVRHDGQAVFAEVMDGSGWRQLRDNEAFMPARSAKLPQVEDQSWVV